MDYGWKYSLPDVLQKATMDELIPIYEEYKSVYVDIGPCAMKKNDKLTELQYEALPGKNS